MEGYWGRLFSQPSAEDKREVTKTQDVHWELMSPVEQEEISQRIKAMDRSTAAGPDGITVRLPRAMPVSALTKLYNLMLLVSYFPLELRHSRMTLIPTVGIGTVGISLIH